jgi:agmatinase
MELSMYLPFRARWSRHAGLRPAPQFARRHHPDFDRMATQGWKALEAEAKLPATAWRKERQWALDMGLPGAESITDRDIPTFARGELPHFAGINTFMKAPYIENVRDVGRYDAAVIGIPFDSGTTYRPGTRFGPQGIRRISALYTPYNYELGVDLREQMTLCDAGDVFTIPANLEKSFDQISRGVAHVFSSGALPIMLGGDHSIGFPCVRGIAQCTDKKIGIIHFDRHIDIQEKDLDERMHTTPWFWATNLPNVPAVNLVQLGIGGWQVPREGVQVARERNTNVLTIADIEKFGIEKSAEIALDLAWKGADAVYISFDVDSIDCGFVPGTGWPEPGGFLPREALKLLGLVCAQGICGFEVVEVSPPYDTSDITALMGVRVVVEALGSLAAHGKLGSHRSIITKPVSY